MLVCAQARMYVSHFYSVNVPPKCEQVSEWVSVCLFSALFSFIKINEHLRLFSHSFETSIERKIDILLENEYGKPVFSKHMNCTLFPFIRLSP